MEPVSEIDAIVYAVKLAPQIDSRQCIIYAARRSHDIDGGIVLATSIGRCDVWRLPNGELYGEF